MDEVIAVPLPLVNPKKQIREISFALQLSASILSSRALYSKVCLVGEKD
jgi:hypothetical protein